MRVVTRDFLNDNEYISYPFDGRATLEPYATKDPSIVNSLVTDMRLTLPRDVAACAFVANITVTKALVTMTIMGSRTHPFSPNTPQASLSNEQYVVLGAFVLAKLQVKKTSGLPGSPVQVISDTPGVGGWVVFGSGILNEGLWSFSGPQASMVSDRCITRYDYGGVTTLGRKGYDNQISGNVTLIGQNGIEVVSDSEGLAIQFSGTNLDIRQGLQSFSGQCGGRPESGTCLYSPIKTVNGLIPQGANREVVVVLDKPMYATIENINTDDEIVVVSSDLPLESFCKTRINIPDGCNGTQPSPNLLGAAPTTSTGVTFSPSTLITFEVSSGTTSVAGTFSYVQQHPTRPATAVLQASAPLLVFDEVLTYLHIDSALGEWQLYGLNGASMYAFGSLVNNLRGNKELQYNSVTYYMSIGPATVYDRMGVHSLQVSIDAPDEFEEEGTYVRYGYARYRHSLLPKYTLELRGASDDSWAMFNDGMLIAAGALSDGGVGTQVQNYTRPDGTSAIRVIAVSGGQE